MSPNIVTDFVEVLKITVDPTKTNTILDFIAWNEEDLFDEVNSHLPEDKKINHNHYKSVISNEFSDEDFLPTAKKIYAHISACVRAAKTVLITTCLNGENKTLRANATTILERKYPDDWKLRSEINVKNPVEDYRKRLENKADFLIAETTPYIEVEEG